MNYRSQAASESGLVLHFANRCQALIGRFEFGTAMDRFEVMRALIQGIPDGPSVRSRACIEAIATETMLRMRLLAHIDQRLTNHRTINLGRKPFHPAVTKALMLIERNAIQPELRLVHIADAVDLSPSHLDKLLKRDTGSTFGEHVRAIRLAIGRRLLETTNLAIKVIAANSGYSQTATLDRVFHAAYGCSPAEWRRRDRAVEATE